jgi:O-antigen/teichoic acid export membrane protein
LGNIGKLAGQTFWYGFSSIIGRFINYLLTPLLTGIYDSGRYGEISILFAYAAFLNIIFTFGMETAYFRFSKDRPEDPVFQTGQTLLLFTSALLGALFFLPTPQIAELMKLEAHPEYIHWVLWIVVLDTLAVLPMARLRHEGRPIRFATIRILGILLNVGLVIFFLVLCKGDRERGVSSVWALFYDPSIDIGYVFLANLAASAFTLLLLWKSWSGFRFRIDRSLLMQMLTYAAPLLIVGFGGMINETIDRFMIVNRFNGTVEAAKSANGIYSANYKLAVLIVLFIQAFRMGAEPFFFRQAKEVGAQRTYARVMKFFVIVCCLCFLGVSLFLDIWKHFMGIRRHPEYLEGLRVVPILMLAKIFLGIYYNLSIWYKLTDRTLTGAWITLGGAAVTVTINYLLVPHWGYMACAWATLACYGLMMVWSYRLGQIHYPVPYAWKKMTAYVTICVLMYLIHHGFRSVSPGIWWTHGMATILLAGFVTLVVRVERRELAKIPLLSRFLG